MVLFSEKIKLSLNLAEERRALYTEPDIARLIASIIQKKEELKPEFDVKYGFRYPEAEKIVRKDPDETRALLRRLAEVGILREEFAEVSIHCPSCGSANISAMYCCPFCDSPRINRNALIEHIACGYIGNIYEFRTDGELICPKCKATIVRGGYRNAGSWYECKSCGKRIELLKITHKCRDCGENFLFDDAKYVEFYSYSLNPDVISELKMGVLFSTLIRDLLADLKVSIRIPGVIRGKSGASHNFDALIKTPSGKIIAVDALISSKPIGQSEISREYGKIIDSQAEVFIIASPYLDREASKLSKAYGLKVFQGEPLDALEKLRKAVRAESE